MSFYTWRMHGKTGNDCSCIHNYNKIKIEQSYKLYNILCRITVCKKCSYIVFSLMHLCLLICLLNKLLCIKTLKQHFKICIQKSVLDYAQIYAKKAWEFHVCTLIYMCYVCLKKVTECQFHKWPRICLLKHSTFLYFHRLWPKFNTTGSHAEQDMLTL